MQSLACERVVDLLFLRLDIRLFIAIARVSPCLAFPCENGGEFFFIKKGATCATPYFTLRTVRPCGLGANRKLQVDLVQTR